MSFTIQPIDKTEVFADRDGEMIVIRQTDQHGNEHMIVVPRDRIEHVIDLMHKVAKLMDDKAKRDSTAGS